MTRFLAGTLGAMLLLLSPATGDDKPAPMPAKEALKPFNELIGKWTATGTMAANRKDFWQETVSLEWQFKGEDAWITVAFTKGKYFDKGTLRYLPDQGLYRLSLTTIDKQTLDFDGRLEKKVLTLEHVDPKAKESQRLVVTMLHEGTRFLYDYAVKPDGRANFTPQYRVGAKREGVSFAAGDSRPECIVSGGLGTMKITYKGKDYYVCCGGCRDAFKDDPEKFIKEYEAKKQKK